MSALVSAPFTFAAAAPVPAAGGTLTLDIRQTVQFALQNSTAFISARNQNEIAELKAKNAHWALFPSLDLTTSFGVQDTNSSLATTGAQNTPYTSALKLSLSETLYDNGVLLTRNKIAGYEQHAARLLYRRERNQLVRDTLEQYMRFSLLSRTSEVLKTQLELIQKQYNLVQNAFKQGLKTRRDFIRFRTQLSRAEIDLAASRTAGEKAKIDLMKVIGVVPEKYSQFSFVPTAAPNLKNVQLPALNYKNHDTYKIAELRVQVSALEADLIARRLYPEIALTGSVDYTASDYAGTGQSVSDNDLITSQALITLKYNFWDWGNRNREKRVALLTQKIEENTLETQMRDLAGDLNKLMLDLEQLRKNYDLTSELLSLEESNYKALEQDYREGRAQYLDLITSLSDLADSRIRYFSSALDLQLAVYTYRFHQGTLYEDFTKNE